MRRSLVLALMISMGHASVAMAGETLVQSGQRIIIRQLRADSKARKAEQAPGTLAQSGMRTRNKILIGLGIAVAFAGVALVIDGGVEDSTPSSRGER